MKVIKIEKPMLAFAFLITAEGTNFEELEADVKENGGTIESISDDLVVIKINGADYTLPLNFAVIINGGVGKIVSRELLEAEYIHVIDDDFDLDGLVERVNKLEAELNSLAATVNGATKSYDKNTKAKA